ncbi:MAG: ArsR/SmtB family transcription factor [bacterium]
MEASTAVKQLSGLAQQTRLSIFRMLVQVGAEGLPAGEIARRLQVPAPTLSVHLSRLEQAGLLVSERRQRQILYAVHPSGIRELMRFLTEDCCEGRPELCGRPPA